MSDTVRSIGLFHLAEERRRLQKHTEMEKPDQAAMSMYKRSWDDIHAAARSMHALMRSTSISSGWAASQVLLHHAKCMQHCRRIWPARRGRQMFQRQGFCRSSASLRRRRGRQTVFREQFLVHLGFNSGPARPAGSL